MNVSPLRPIAIREKSALQFRWEVFNALNHANFNQFVCFVNTPNARHWHIGRRFPADAIRTALFVLSRDHAVNIRAAP